MALLDTLQTLHPQLEHFNYYKYIITGRYNVISTITR